MRPNHPAKTLMPEHLSQESQHSKSNRKETTNHILLHRKSISTVHDFSLKKKKKNSFELASKPQIQLNFKNAKICLHSSMKNVKPIKQYQNLIRHQKNPDEIHLTRGFRGSTLKPARGGRGLLG